MDEHNEAAAILLEGAGKRLLVARAGLFKQREGGSGRLRNRYMIRDGAREIQETDGSTSNYSLPPQTWLRSFGLSNPRLTPRATISRELRSLLICDTMLLIHAALAAEF